MWELFQIMLKDKITPNQCLLLFAVRNKISTPQINAHLELKALKSNGYLITDGHKLIITDEGQKMIIKYNNYFVKSKKRTNSQIMGKDFLDNIKKYREMFPARKASKWKAWQKQC